jgi:subtilisin
MRGRIMSGGAVFALLAGVTTVGRAATGTAATTTTGDYIVVLEDGVSEPTAAADHVRKGAQIFQHYRHALNGYAAKLSGSQLAAVRADSRVRFVAPDQVVHATACNVRIVGTQRLPCSVDRIDGDLSSTHSGDGSGSVNVNVAVLDTGIDLNHPDLNVVGGKSCLPGGSFADQNGHGTHVGGTIGMIDNTIGRVGVAPGARLWAVRVLDKHGSGSTSKIICGIDFVTSTRTDADPSNDIAVANMSLGGKGRDDGNCGLTKKDPVHVAICNSVQAGVVYAVSAGNSAADLQDFYPAAYNEVLTATALSDFDGQPGALASQPGGETICSLTTGEADDMPGTFSNFATLSSDQAHTVAAPGICVDSTYADVKCSSLGATVPCYAYSNGTSMASPHVAGTVALCIASGPCAGLTPAQIIQKIVADAQAYNVANPGYGFTGDPQHPIAGKYYGNLIRAAAF